MELNTYREIYMITNIHLNAYLVLIRRILKIKWSRLGIMSRSPEGV